jgi:hypothetical protein
MTQINDTCRGRRPSGARRPGASRIATRRTRMSSDAVVSAYIREIAQPHSAMTPLIVERPAWLDDPDARHLLLRNEDR